MKTLAGVLSVVVCLAFTSGCRTSKEGYVAKGNKLYDAGKYADADIAYNKALQKDANYGEAYYRLGLVSIKEESPRAAFNALFRAVQLLPNNTDAKEELGSLSLEYYLLDQTRPQIYYNIIKQISSALLQKDPNSFEGIREKAYLAMTDGKQDESIALFRKALEVRPAEPTVTTALMESLFQNGHAGEAEKLGLDLIASQKSYGPAYDLLYGWYVNQKREAEAENIVKEKVANNPKQGNYLLELAAHYDRMRKPAEMQATLQRLLDDPKDFPQSALLVGDFYLKIRNYPEAVRYYDEGSRRSKGVEKVLYQKRATNALLAQGKGAQASSAVDQIIEENPKDLEARHIQANLLLKSGDPQKIDAAEREFEDLSKQKPKDASLSYELGRSEELKGNLDAAKVRYQQAVAKNTNYLPARYALAQLDLSGQKPNEALEQTAAILKIRPDDQRARLLNAQALARTGNIASARMELMRLKDFQHNTAAQVELGLLALSQKRFQEAEQILSKLTETGDPEAIAGLADAYVSQKQLDKAQEILNYGLKKSNNSPLLLSDLGKIQAAAGQYDAAIATFQKLVALKPKSPQEHLELAEVFGLKGDDNNAVAMYREAAKLAPDDPQTGLELARGLSRAGRTDEARTQYQALVKAHPDNAFVLNDMAYFLCESGGNLDQALGLAQRALQIDPGQPSFSDTMGYIYLKKGLDGSALQVFENLVKKFPNYPTFRYHLGEALLKKGDKTSAKRELQAALNGHLSRQDQARVKELLGKIG